jgi:hypothetical protein
MQLLDVRTLTNPVCVSDTPVVGTFAENLAVRLQDDYAFVSSGSYDGDFHTFDIGNRATPHLLGQTNGGADYEEIRLSGGLAYLGHDSGMDVYDVADLRAPHRVGSVSFDRASNDDCYT